MKRVVAIVNRDKFAEIKEALGKAGVEEMIVGLVKGCGRQDGGTDLYRGVEYAIEFVPRIKIEILLLDNAKAAQVVEVIRRAARMNTIGCGRIFVETVTTI